MGIFSFINIAICLITLNACQSNFSADNKANVDSTIHYAIDLEKRHSFELPSQLDEVSGHTFVPTNNDIAFCIQDENGIVFGFDLRSRSITSTIAFGPDGDYEGITNDGINFYVLKSNGSIYSFPISTKDQKVNAKSFNKLLGKGEYESLGVDTVNKQLVILCKSCKADRKKNQLTGYRLNYDQNGNVSLANSFIIDNNQVRENYADFPRVFNPSAVTKNYATGEWYVLSSIDKLILILDTEFKPKVVVPFSRKHYEQPEGIAFDNQGNLYISSEKGDASSAMLYKIK